MLGNKKIRNPFPKIGLVFKYEFLSGTRTFIPVYLATIVLCLISGICFTDTISKIANEKFLIFLGVACALMSFASFIITIVFIEKRFKKGMMENEAYMNLSLPVTMTEHVCGRLLAYFIWGCIYIVSSAIAGLLMASSEWKSLFQTKAIKEAAAYFLSISGMHLTTWILMIAVYVISVILLFVMFIFLMNSIVSLVKKCRLLVELAAVIVFFFIFGNILNACLENLSGINDFSAAIIGLRRLIILNFSTVVVSVIGTISILKFRLNLEA